MRSGPQVRIREVDARSEMSNSAPSMTQLSRPTTLVGLLHDAPADRTAIILPEQNIRVSYGELREQVQALAEGLAAAGIRRGDRVGMALPNGLPTIVAFSRRR